MSNELHFSQSIEDHLRLIVESYTHFTKKELIEIPQNRFSELSDAMWHAPCAIVAHGNENEPIFFYGNKLALALFEMDFATFIRMPSHKSAEPLHWQDRERLLSKVALHGFVNDYSGVRVSSSGRRFLIKAATVWNIIDQDGVYHGQAAKICNWHYLD